MNFVSFSLFKERYNMKEITQYNEKTFESIKHITDDGEEFWTARELQEVLEYSKWGNFKKVIDKAKEACINSDVNVSYHFADVGKMIAYIYIAVNTSFFSFINYLFKIPPLWVFQYLL